MRNMFHILAIGTALTVAAGTALAAELVVGSVAPAASALDQNGQKVNLADAYKSGYTLVYFYPKADTPGCTKQACSLRDSFAQLSDRGVKVYGVSHDNVESQKAFQDKYKLPFSLLADTQHDVSKAFGVPSQGEYAARQAFLIKDGKIVWLDRQASTAEQAADVLAALDAMK